MAKATSTTTPTETHTRECSGPTDARWLTQPSIKEDPAQPTTQQSLAHGTLGQGTGSKHHVDPAPCDPNPCYTAGTGHKAKTTGGNRLRGNLVHDTAPVYQDVIQRSATTWTIT